jgi:hypothetical protein
VIVATTPLISFRLVFVGLRIVFVLGTIVFALGSARPMLSLALVLSIGGSRITIVNGSLLFFVMSVVMHFWQRLGTCSVGMHFVPFCLKQCLDQLRINSKTPLMVLLLKDHVSGKYGRQCLLNFLRIRWFLLTKSQLRANFMHNMIEFSYSFEILYAEVISFMGSLR